MCCGLDAQLVTRRVPLSAKRDRKIVPLRMVFDADAKSPFLISSRGLVTPCYFPRLGNQANVTVKSLKNLGHDVTA